MDSHITSELVEAYSQCSRKAFLLVRGDPQGEQHDYCRAVADRAAAARPSYLAAHDGDEWPSGYEKREKGDAQGSLVLSAGDLRAACDALLRSNRGGSPVQIEPHLVVGTPTITREQRTQLAFAGHVIGETRRHRPTHGTVVLFNGKPHRIRLLPLYPAVGVIIDVLRKWSKHLPADPPSLILNRHCATCPFHSLCLKEGEQHDNLSLLERMTPKVMQKYRKRGIFTIEQLSYAYRPRRQRKRPASAPPVFNMELQALAIRTGKIYLHERATLPKHPVELFLDIEGLPDEDLDYLIGLDVREGDQVSEYSFWADSADQEVEIFKNCLDIAAGHPGAPLFHYGSYEPRAFARIAKKHGIKCDWLIKRLVNVNTAIYGKVYFPARSNRLKDLATLVGASWNARDASGLQSIAWRWRWQETHEDSCKKLLLAYNRDDCRALRLLTAELQGIGHAAQARADVDFANAPKQNSTPTGEGIYRVFEGILNSAHADYERKRVRIRSSPAIDHRQRPQRASRKLGWATVKDALPSRIGKVVRVPRKRTCPRHPSQPLIPKEALAEHTIIDLAFAKTGCRKTLTKYAGKKAQCPVCQLDYLPPAIGQLQARVFGHNLQAWAVYQHVALRLPYAAISQLSADMFSEELNRATTLGFVRQFAREYARTEELLLGRILRSPFIHADETKINIRGTSHYVWVLTSGDHVIFRKTETRETTLIRNLLDGYSGVLISDFYAGYDSVVCRQQKCLVHLIRDLNDDLWKNPFNRQYEVFVGAVRDLLVPIFTDVDKYGLKRTHLHKHRRAVDRFYRTTIEADGADCEIAEKYRKRFVRYRESIFRFLDEDGLPWNNNAAERAIRHLAIQRKISGSFSESGANEYLRLLGISQTCRFQNKSFLRFLLSGKKDVEEYVERRRRATPKSKPPNHSNSPFPG